MLEGYGWIHILDILAHVRDRYIGWFDVCLRDVFGIWFEDHLGYWEHGLICTLVYNYISWYTVDEFYGTYLSTWLMDVMVHVLVHG
jgi:hypothetical protein